MNTIHSQTAQSLAESMFCMPSADISGKTAITFQLLLRAIQNTTDNRDEGIRVIINTLVDMQIRSVLEELAQDKVGMIGKAKPEPWTPEQITRGEAALSKCVDEAAAELCRLLIPTGEESDSQVYASFGIAIAYVWGLEDVGYARFCQGTLASDTDILKLGPPAPDSGDIS